MGCALHKSELSSRSQTYQVQQHQDNKPPIVMVSNNCLERPPSTSIDRYFVTVRGKPPNKVNLQCGQTLPSANQIQPTQAFRQEQLVKQKLQVQELKHQQSVLQQFMASYEKMRFYYDEHDIDRAHHYAQVLYKKFGFQLDNLSLDAQKRQQYQKLLRKVQREYKDVVEFNEEIYRVAWNEQSNDNGVKVSTRLDGDTVGTLIESVIDIPFERFITVLIQMGLYAEYTPFMVQSRLQKKVARNVRVGFNSNKFPLLTVRQTYFQGVGYNRLDHDGTLFMYTRSIENRKDLQQEMQYYPKLNPKAVQLQYKYFVLKYEPIARGKGKVTAAINGDLKVSMVPLWLLNFLAVKFGNDFFQKIVQISRNYQGSQWEKNTIEDPALHNFFKKSIDNYLTKKGM